LKVAPTLDRPGGAAKHGSAMRCVVRYIALAGLAANAPSAKAVDGCLVLLCFAAPNWHAIPQCVPPITQVLKDLAKGKPFPTCAMAGTGNKATHAWADAPTYCPPQYTHVIQSESSSTYICDYVGAVSVSINAAPFTTTWWSGMGDTVTEFSPAAKAQLGTWDTRFDDDYAAWKASLPLPPPPDN
jgi:hypothetical protein